MGIMESHRPASVKCCALLHKPVRAEVDVQVDYIGFTIPDEWVVGYGLDYAEHDRTLPYIGIVHPDDRQEDSPQRGGRIPPRRQVEEGRQ